MLAGLFSFVNRFPSVRRRLWKQWYRYLGRRYRHSEWVFMNFGLAPDPDKPQILLDERDDIDRSWVLLYHHVAGAIDLRGRTVLEIGSGRGGGASYVKRALGPQSVVGLDISETAVSLCHERHQVDGLSFQQGDAETLPFPAASFDVVLNVESSHCYGSMPRFLAEVRRVLRPGGYFLYADFRPLDQMEQWHSDLGAAGFVEKSRTDITARVIAALNTDNDRRTRLIERIVPASLNPTFRQFAAVPGSLVHTEFCEKRLFYMSFVMQSP